MSIVPKRAFKERLNKILLENTAYAAKTQQVLPHMADRSKMYKLFINCTRNNTHANISMKGEVIGQASAGMLAGVKKAGRGTADAGFNTVSLLWNIVQGKLDPAIPFHVFLKGFGPGRDQAFKSVVDKEVKIDRISDVTIIKFGGNRAKKPRR